MYALEGGSSAVVEAFLDFFGMCVGGPDVAISTTVAVAPRLGPCQGAQQSTTGALPGGPTVLG